MIGRAMVQVYGWDESRLLDTYKATKRSGIGATRFSHGGPLHLLDDCTFDRLRFDHRPYADKHILFLIRDLRDTMVSFYFQQAKREKVFSGDIHAFLRDARFGVRKIVRFYTLWYQNRGVTGAFELLRYEDMRLDPIASLRKALEFVGVKIASEEMVEQIVEFASFENMRSMEVKGQFNRKMMKPGDASDDESFKVRKGKIGGYVDYLNQEDLSYIDAVVADLGDPHCDWYVFDSPAI